MEPIEMSNAENRLYPHWIPIQENEPTKDKFEKTYKPEFGWCIVSRAHFAPGETIARIYGGIIKPKSQLHTVQKSPDVHLLDEWFTGLITHSCDPLTYFDAEEETFVAIKEINPGDVVTCDYEVTEDYLSRSFECNCGAENCRKTIRGRLAKH
jgi:tyrocidine synthetase-3